MVTTPRNNFVSLAYLLLAILSVASSSYLRGHDPPKPKSVQQTPDGSISRVHLIYMNHLDVGFDGIYPERGLINNVLNKYFTEYFPRAINVSANLTDSKFVETFKYTTHPWLLDLYFNCPPNLVLSGVKLKCPDDKQKAMVREAIDNEIIIWHAGAMNIQYENNSPLTVSMGLDVGKRLEKMFNKPKKYRVVSQRDIPGLTRSVIPYFKAENIIGVTNGINAGCPPADLPAKVVNWKSPQGEIIYMHTEGGYPNNPGPDPNHPGGLSMDNCHHVDGFDQVLCFAFRTDNSGPPVNHWEVLSYYEILRAEYPNAKVFASSLEDYFELLLAHTQKLPIFEKEIGDQWIQGATSDPLKISTYKSMVRVFDACFQSKDCSMSDPRVVNASRFLIKIGEHTLGLDTVSDTINWSNDYFYQVRKEKNFQLCEMAWNEQREFLVLTLEALEDHPVKAKILDSWKELKPKKPDLHEYLPISEPMQKCSNDVSFKSPFATSENPIAQILYQTYNETDDLFFESKYNWQGAKGWNTGYGKQNSTVNAHPKSQSWPVRAIQFFKHKTDPCTFTVQIAFGGVEPIINYGGPYEFWNTYVISKTGIDVSHQWFGKPPTRLMEAIFVKFPVDDFKSETDVSFSKLNYSVSPHDVVFNGSQWQHVVDDLSVSVRDNTGNLKMEVLSFDAPLACPYTAAYGPTVWPVPLDPIKDRLRGVAFAPYNNVWDVNFIFWYPFNDEDANYKCRFRVNLP